MEDVLDVYTRPYDPQRPQVCMDETHKQLVGETRVPVPGAPGRVARHDYEYVRNGVANLFMFFEPLAFFVRERHDILLEHPGPPCPGGLARRAARMPSWTHQRNAD